jgi:excisionase family DNA binding protein
MSPRARGLSIHQLWMMPMAVLRCRQQRARICLGGGWKVHRARPGNGHPCLMLSRLTYVTTDVACKTLGVSDQTLRRWAKAGLIEWYRVTDTGHRHYDVEDSLQREKRRLAEKVAVRRVTNRNRTRKW